MLPSSNLHTLIVIVESNCTPGLDRVSPPTSRMIATLHSHKRVDSAESSHMSAVAHIAQVSVGDFERSRWS